MYIHVLCKRHDGVDMYLTKAPKYKWIKKIRTKRDDRSLNQPVIGLPSLPAR